MQLKRKLLSEAELMLDIYAEFAENFMAMPVIKGLKTESERFAGAEETYCIEASNARWKSFTSWHISLFRSKFCKSF